MRAAVVRRSVANIGALAVGVGRAVSAFHPNARIRCVYSYAPVRRLPVEPSVRYASTVSTSTTAPIEADTTQAKDGGSNGSEGDEEAELQRLQTIIKDKLAKQKQRLLEQLSPLPGEQTSGFKRRTRAQREAERTTTTADSSDAQQQPVASEQDEQSWQQVASPLPLRKPTHLHTPSAVTSTTTPQPRSTSPPHTRRSTHRTEQSQSSTADVDTAAGPHRRSRLTDPNLNPDRQSMLHERNARQQEQKRVRLQRRLEREETERTVREDDELFHDVSSPRQKLRGASIAGSTVLAKHQRHSKGVREGERQLEAAGSVEERMGRSVLSGGEHALSGINRVNAERERDHHRRQLKYAERGERGSRHEWAGAGKPGRWEAREQKWQSGRSNGRIRRVGEEYVGAQRPRGHGVAPHPYGRSVNKRDVPTPAAPSRSSGREEVRRGATKREDRGVQSKDQYSWLSDMKQQASNVQQQREEREAKRDRGRGRR